MKKILTVSAVLFIGCLPDISSAKNKETLTVTSDEVGSSVEISIKNGQREIKCELSPEGELATFTLAVYVKRERIHFRIEYHVLLEEAKITAIDYRVKTVIDGQVVITKSYHRDRNDSGLFAGMNKFVNGIYKKYKLRQLAKETSEKKNLEYRKKMEEKEARGKKLRGAAPKAMDLMRDILKMQ